MNQHEWSLYASPPIAFHTLFCILPLSNYSFWAFLCATRYASLPSDSSWGMSWLHFTSAVMYCFNIYFLVTLVRLNFISLSKSSRFFSCFTFLPSLFLFSCYLFFSRNCVCALCRPRGGLWWCCCPQWCDCSPRHRWLKSCMSLINWSAY